ncbi:S9 family peptidase [Kocuria tytonicola]|uniref:alpha/beta hydrolase family protein n=1 Tax=Kocuria tytonicola TaxID=2055946 RepID=UPI000EF86778|nr:alpha/beta fold hydrolase [Kocuria tytonicola]RLZ04298.1 S9 family peptidase [Kocuria tytonicola]
MTSRYATPADLVATPRLAGLAAHRDGPVVALRQELSPDGTRYVTHAWAVPARGEPVQLTHDERGVREACPTGSGTVWFTSDRPVPGDEDKRTRLWLLPERGEARAVLDAPEGISHLQLGGDRLFFVSGLHPAARGAQDEFARNRESHDRREETGVSAVLHDRSPIRFWDHDLPAAEDALWFLDTGSLSADDDAAGAVRRVELPAGRLGHVSVAPDGTWLLVEMAVVAEGGVERTQLWRIPLPAPAPAADSPEGAGAADSAEREGAAGEPAPSRGGPVGAGEAELLHDASVAEQWSPGEVSPDGSRVVLTRHRLWRDGVNMALSLWVRDMATGEEIEAVPWDEHWAADAAWLDDDSFVCVSDHRGRGIVLRVHCPRGGDVRVQTAAGGADQDWTYSSVRVAGEDLVGLRASYAHPAQLVRWSAPGAAASDAGARATSSSHGDPAPSDAPEGSAGPAPVTGLVPDDAVPGRLEEVTTTAGDGTEIRAWLALPESAAGTRHPLVVFVHGGPWGSNNQWSWRWNPWPFVAKGYAVLLPDPAISTGYGQSMIERGQQELGGAPFTDVMALVDATTARADIDPEKQALMGGSYGGYMANWVATHTGGRFRCIVTHASLWNLDSMGATTDNTLWREAMGPSQAAEYSPHRFVERIEVPLLVIHGDKDYRVPVSQGLELWADLQRSTSVAGHRFLYYPDEGHWILKPANARTWYETTLAFLDQHVLGKDWERPELLG